MSGLRLALPVTRPLPLLDAESTRALETKATEKLAGHALMDRAGESIARLAIAVAPHARRFWIAAGPGNNGGDGLGAAVHLRAAGKEVEISLLAGSAHHPTDAARALSRARAAGLSIVDAPVPSRTPDLAIDALLGMGATRAPEGFLADAIRAVNAVEGVRLAVDLPSGLDPTRGRPLGASVVRATQTLALMTLKPGLFTAEGRDYAGCVWLDDLGIDTEAPPTPRAWLIGRPHGLAPRLHAQHKGSFGDVGVVGGGPGMVGGAVLAARAAHAGGAGRVYVSLIDRSDAAPALDLVRPELMFRRDWSRSPPETLASSTVVCGCGGGDGVREPMPRLLSAATRLVLDADALNALAADATLQDLLRARAGRGAATVLTPHPLEAARLLGTDAKSVQADRLRAAEEIAKSFTCIVVLKGSGSVIAAPNEIPRINSTGNASLATAGTGDVLAGWLAGRWAHADQGLDAKESAFAAACRAVAEHGAAAEPAPPGALRASDLIERLVAQL